MSEEKKAKPVILASKSRIRAEILEKSGILYETAYSDVDENYYKSAYKNENTKDLAMKIAFAKAYEISKINKDRIVIGLDQILEIDGVRLDKPESLEQAFEHLKMLRGKTHKLVNGMVLVRNSDEIWKYSDIIKLEMRDFTNDFLKSYLEKAGSDILNCVGAYQLEGLGSQLFSKVDGSYFSVLGLPLLPLQEYLRKIGILEK